MQRIVIVGMAALCLLTGCVSGPAPGTDAGPTATPTGTATETPTATPDSGDGGTPTATPDDEPTPYEIKRALESEFDIGISFGMPTVYTEEQMRDYISDHEALADRIRSDYDLNDTRDLFVKVNQFTQITLSNGSDGVYDFTIRSGNSCEIVTINGTYDAGSETITVEDESTETVPC